LKRTSFALLGAIAAMSFAAAPSGPSVAVNNGSKQPPQASAALTPQPYEKDIEGIVGGMLEDYHYLKHPVDDEISKRWLDSYIDELDYYRTTFLQSDIDEFRKSQTQLDDDLHSKPPKLELALKIYSRYAQRLRERVAYEQTLLAKPLDLTNKESYVPDRHEAKLSWPATTAEANDLWRQRTEDEMISSMMSEDQRDSEADIRARLAKRYTGLLKDLDDRESTDVLEEWLDALTRSYDPHSAWLKPASSDDFDIEITNSVQGIGAQLKTEDDYTTVSDVVLGGPAEKDHRMRKDDRILTVAQGDAEPVDVVGMRIDKVVKLIRGQKGTVVKLAVEHKDGTREVIDLIRDQVMLEDSAAEGHLETVNGHKLGVVALPGFYVDPSGSKGGRRASEDVKRELVQLQQQGAEGVILDLRGNGGGSLVEAIDVAGLFLPGGPVVQVRSRDGEIEALPDKDPGYAWGGPMLVMTDATSASASEIVAGALQDYGRALIVGDRSTHGKGSVQQIAPLTQQLKGRYTDDVGGELKITVQKFYRVSGGSTQNKGVEADVVLPSAWDGLEVHEADLDYAMPWDQIPPAPHVRTGNFTNLLPELQQRSAARVASNPEYQRLGRQLEIRSDDKAHPEVSLVLADRKTELADRKAKIAAPDDKDDKNDKDLTPEQRKAKLRKADYGLDEGLAVLSDLITLQPSVPAPGPRAGH